MLNSISKCTANTQLKRRSIYSFSLSLPLYIAVMRPHRLDPMMKHRMRLPMDQHCVHRQQNRLAVVVRRAAHLVAAARTAIKLSPCSQSRSMRPNRRQLKSFRMSETPPPPNPVLHPVSVPSLVQCLDIHRQSKRIPFRRRTRKVSMGFRPLCC